MNWIIKKSTWLPRSITWQPAVSRTAITSKPKGIPLTTALLVYKHFGQPWYLIYLSFSQRELTSSLSSSGKLDCKLQFCCHHDWNHNLTPLLLLWARAKKTKIWKLWVMQFRKRTSREGRNVGTKTEKSIMPGCADIYSFNVRVYNLQPEKTTVHLLHEPLHNNFKYWIQKLNRVFGKSLLLCYSEH